MSSEISTSALHALQSTAHSFPPLPSIISDDHSTIRFDQSQSFPSSTQCVFPKLNDDSTMLKYSLLSLLLQIHDPKVSVLNYRKFCKKYNVQDPVKTLDKEAVLQYFHSGSSSVDDTVNIGDTVVRKDGDGSLTRSSSAGGEDEIPSSDLGQEKGLSGSSKQSQKQQDRSSSSSHHNRRIDKKARHRGEKDRKSSSSHRKNKKHRPSSHSKDDTRRVKKGTKQFPMTQDQLCQGLKIVVDKRSNVDAIDDGKNNNEDVLMTTENEQTLVDEDMSEILSKQQSIDKDASSHTQQEDPPKLLTNEEEDERLAVMACLSSDGYNATKIPPEVLKRDRAEVEKIMTFEMPVGDSASILRCGVSSTSSSRPKSKGTNTNTRDFTRVLELYNETLLIDKRSTPSSSRKAKPAPPPRHRPKPLPTPHGKPIIVVPSAMTSPINLLNAYEFFQNANFIPRETMLKRLKGKKRPTSVANLKHEVSSRLGGGAVEYELIDNPAIKLKSREDWDRVVAVVAQGAAWQFKGWKIASSGGGSSSIGKSGTGDGRGTAAAVSPVDVFSQSFGFYVGYEGTPLPKGLQGWNVKKEKLSRDKRGFDTVVYASFWNGLDEWMGVHKRQYLPTPHGEQRR